MLLIGGSDSSAGAGIAADIRAIQHHSNIHASIAITAITAQHTYAVTHIQPTTDTALQAQLEAAETLAPIDAIKIGMLCNTAQCAVLGRFLKTQTCPIVIDTVLVASSGDALLDEAAYESYQAHVLPHADLITPNTTEADLLRKKGAYNPSALPLPFAVLEKGGHVSEVSDTVTDKLTLPDGEVLEYSHKRQEMAPRGTGCALATHIAAGMAEGEALTKATEQGIALLQQRMRRSQQVGDMCVMK